MIGRNKKEKKKSLRKLSTNIQIMSYLMEFRGCCRDRRKKCKEDRPRQELPQLVVLESVLLYQELLMEYLILSRSIKDGILILKMLRR